MAAFRRILDWFKYERLGHYPALKAFDRHAALVRLMAYEREEREACEPWVTLAWILIVILAGIWWLLSYFSPDAKRLGFLAQVPVWVVQYVLYRRIRHRVDAKVAAELGDGRLWKCIECGYDLRSSNERCPECGAAVKVAPPTKL